MIHEIRPENYDAYFFCECRRCLTAAPQAPDAESAKKLAYEAGFRLVSPGTEMTFGWICAPCQLLPANTGATTVTPLGVKR